MHPAWKLLKTRKTDIHEFKRFYNKSMKKCLCMTAYNKNNISLRQKKGVDYFLRIRGYLIKCLTYL